MSETQRSWTRAFFAACMALVMTLCAACAFNVQQAFAADDDTVLTVYLKASEDSEAYEMKEYTQADLEALAEEGSASAMYWKDSWTVATATKYVTLENLFSDAGISIESADTVTTAQMKGTDNPFSQSASWTSLSTGSFYPAAGATSFEQDNAVAAPAVLGLTYASSAVSTTAGDAATANAANQSANGTPKLLYGLTNSVFNQTGVDDGNCAGKRLVGNVDTITVTKSNGAYLSIYTKASEDSERVLVKSFTKAELEALAEDGSASAQYWKGSGWTVATTTQYVSYEDLFSQAGVEVSGADIITSAAPDGFSANATWTTLSTGSFYPAAGATDFEKEGAVASPAVLGLTYAASAVETTSAAAAEVNAANQSASQTPKLIFGLTNSVFGQTGVDNGDCAGKRLASSVNEITITSTETPYFSVYTKASDSADPVLVKSYTKAEFEALASTGSVSGQMWKNSAWQVLTTTSYVSLEDLFGDAGVAVSARDTVTSAAADGFSSSDTWGNLSGGFFYPQAGTTDFEQGGAVAVSAVYGLTYAGSDVTTTAAAAATANEGNQSADSCPRLLYGLSNSAFTQEGADEGACAGRRFASSVNSVTVTAAQPVERLYGDEAYETSAAISGEAFNAAENVVIARDDDFQDAMSAAGLAGVLNAPILLTNKDELSSTTLAEIQRLGAKNAYVIGGNLAVSDKVFTSLQEAGLTVDRIFGSESWETSMACAARITELKVDAGEELDAAIVAMSDNFQDAMSISSFAYKYHVPIILATSGETSAQRVLTDDAVTLLTGGYANAKVYVPGGNAALSEASVEDVVGADRVVRKYGTTGFETSVALASYFVEQNLLSNNVVTIACGAQAPKGVDALSGSALAGLNGGIILLATTSSTEPVDTENVTTYLDNVSSDVSKAYILGGNAVLSDDFMDTVETILS